jgi:hypothetical protein
MNAHDQANLRFLLSANAESLKSWYESASYSDLVYANELMDRYAVFLQEEILAAQIEQEIDAMLVFTAAQAVIDRVKA